MVGVQQWAEVRRLHFVRGLSIREIHRRTGLHRDTIRSALKSDDAPRYSRAPAGRSSIRSRTRSTGCCATDPKLPGQRVRELIAQLGFDGGKTIVDDYLREVRPLFAPPPRTFQRTVYRPGEVCQFDLWEPRAEVPVGHGQTRRGWVVVACLGYSRAGAGALIFSKQTPDLLAGIARCLWSLGALPRDAGLGPPGRPARPRRPAERGVRGVLRPAEGRLAFLRAGGPAGQGRRRAAAGLHRAQLRARPSVRERARLPVAARHLVRRARQRPPSQDAALPAGRPAARGTPADGAAAGRRRRTPIGAGCSASRPIRTCALIPATTRSTPAWSAGASRSASRRREVLAVALDTGELACRHQRSFAKHRTVTDLAHARALRAGRVDAEPAVEIRPLARYDALIA